MSPDEPQNPEVTAALAAIDAAIAGEPTDPDHAEVAEIALLVVAERPAPAPEFAAGLDGRVERRFGRASRDVAPAPSERRSRGGWWWILAPLAGVAAGLIALIALAPGGGSQSSSSSATFALKPRASAPRSALRSPAHAGAQSVAPPRAGALSVAPPHPASRSEAPTAAGPGLQLPATGRKLIQSSQLSLGAPSSRIDTVAQEVFNVVGAQNGFVNSSTVTATGGTGGYARFQLTMPSATLPQTMTELSRLRYATVLSRTDKVEDVTGQLARAKRRHQKARVRALERGVAYSQIAVTIAPYAPGPAHGHHAHGGGFTIGRAARIALQVLTVIGGILLIAMAVLVPAALVGLAGGRTAGAVRHRRRERALDIA